MMPSTFATATIGGFVAGGSGGIGSVRWGALRDLGNIIRLRVVTMEAEPRVLDFRGDELPRVSHAYGTNGIITELEMPLAPAYDWVEMFVGFDDFMDCARFGLTSPPGRDPVQARHADRGADSLRLLPAGEAHVDERTSLIALMVAPHAMDAFETFAKANGAPKVIYRSDASDWEKGPGAVGEYTWNHTTLRALKVKPSVTYLQVRYGHGEEGARKIARIREIFGTEVLQHLEVLREGGAPAYAALPIVDFTTEERLDEIVRIHEAEGCMVFNPHRYTLEEGGRQTVDDRQLRFKKEADPKGLLNPGQDDRLGRSGLGLRPDVHLPEDPGRRMRRGRGARAVAGAEAGGAGLAGGSARPRDCGTPPREYFAPEEADDTRARSLRASLSRELLGRAPPRGGRHAAGPGLGGRRLRPERRGVLARADRGGAARLS
jgi:hypothetical protein